MDLRLAKAEDASAIAEIYAHHVLTGLGTFEEIPPDPAEMARRMKAVQQAGLPYLVAEAGGRVHGFAYAAPFRPRSAYRFAVEDSIYVRPDSIGRGLGRALLGGVIDACIPLGVRQVIAVIGDSANQASIGLHHAMGFRPAGVLQAVGFKFNAWVDVVFMQRALDGGADAPPSAAGLDL
jgi:phosphinothricin acetyltransferase